MSDKKPDATNQGPVLKIRNGTDFATADVYFRGRHVFEIGRLSQRTITVCGQHVYSTWVALMRLAFNADVESAAREAGLIPKTKKRNKKHDSQN